jgi:hypothetical protein
VIALFAALAFAQDDDDGAPAPPRDTGSGLWDTGGGGEDCAGAQVIDTTPSEGAVNVPVDVHPTVQFDGGCGGGGTYEIAVLDATTREVFATMSWTAPSTLPAIATLIPSSPLPYDRDLVLSVTAYYGTFAYVPFHTAAVDVEPLVGTLTVDVLEASFVRGNVADQLTATVRVVPIVDPAGLSRVELTGPHGVSRLDPIALGEPLVIEWLGVATEQVCFEALQEDGRGGKIGPARDCASLELPEPEGCGCDGSRAPLGLGAVGILLAFRRRRQG